MKRIRGIPSTGIALVLIGVVLGWTLSSSLASNGGPAHAHRTTPVSIIALDFGDEGITFVAGNTSPHAAERLAMFLHPDYVSVQVYSDARWLGASEFDPTFDAVYTRPVSSDWRVIEWCGVTVFGRYLSDKVVDQIRRTGKVRLKFHPTNLPLPKEGPDISPPTIYNSGSEWIEAKVVVCTP